MHTYLLGRWTFLRLLGVVYLVAFVSLWTQVDGLIGSDGILPVDRYLDWIRDNSGTERYWKVPTLLWLGPGDTMLHVLCGTGVLLSLLLIAGVAPIPVLLLLWSVYLSLVQGGQAFLSFQWDILLLETGFVAMFLAPPTLWSRSVWSEPPPRRTGLWLIWLLLFKLMFLSGLVKLISLDRAWWELTALDYHYYTQPLPSWTSWHAHQLPAWFQKASVFVMLILEILVPNLIFCGRAGRRLAFAGTSFLMLAIAGTGNYGFFNLLTIVLCVPLLDDAWLLRCHRARARPVPAGWPPVEERRAWRGRLVGFARAVAVVGLLTVSGLTFVREMVRTVPTGGIEGPAGKLFEVADRTLSSWGNRNVLRWTDPFRTISGYGLFRAMTTERPEIVVEGSTDGRAWVTFEFKWKPGDPSRPPRFVAPHMPRLDWQMWFAALSPRRQQAWIEGMMRRLLEGSPEVLGLLADGPFPGEPPRFVRLVRYRYRFTTPEQRRETGHWWRRERLGLLTRPLSLDDFE